MEERRKTELFLLWQEDLVICSTGAEGSMGQSQEKHRNVHGGPVARLSRQTTQDRKSSKMGVRPVYPWRGKEERKRLGTEAKFPSPLGVAKTPGRLGLQWARGQSPTHQIA